MGGLVAGSGVLGHGIKANIDYYSPPQPPGGCRSVGELGVGALGQHVFASDTATDCTNLFTDPVDPNGFTPSVGFFTPNGVQIGNVRMDCQNPAIEWVTWEKDSQGCREAKLQFAGDSAPFNLLPQMLVRINWVGGNDEAYQYTGICRYYDYVGNTEDKVTLTIKGLVEQVRELRKDDTYVPGGGGDDVGLVVQYLVQTYVDPETNAAYVPGLIDTLTGETVTTTIELGKYPLSQVFDTLALLASKPELGYSYFWGVNGKGEFFFQKEDVNITRVFQVGYAGVDSYSPKPMPERMINQVTVRRKKVSGSNNAGWEIAHVESDTVSIDNFGLQNKEVQVPGYFTTDLCTRIAQSIVNEGSAIKIGADIKKIPLNKPDDFYVLNEKCRVISPPAIYNKVASELEGTAGWIQLATVGDTVISSGAPTVVTGSDSLRIQYTNGTGDIFRLPINEVGFIKKIIVYFRSTKAGTIIRIGAGFNAWNEQTIDVKAVLLNTYYAVELEYNQRRLGFFGFEIIDTDTVTATTIYMDRVEVLKSGHEHTEFNMERQKVVLKPGDSYYDLRVGPEPIAAEDHVAGLIDLVENLEATNEVV